MTHQNEKRKLDELFSGVCSYCDGSRTIEYRLPLENKNDKELEYEISEESCKYCNDTSYNTYTNYPLVYVTSPINPRKETK